ncbi:MAG: PAS domain-containing sensor histidine kinase [Alphaproteobacteria bacterium]
MTEALTIDTEGWSLIGVPIWVFDLDHHRVLWGNEAAVEFWRAESLAELQARDMSNVSDVTHSRLREYADRFSRDESVDAAWTLYPKGEPVTVRLRCCGVPQADGRTAMLVHAIDLDELAPEQVDRSEELRQARDQLAQAEARFRAFAEAGSDWLWETDENHRFVYYSSSVFNYYGYPLDEVLGVTRLELMQDIGVESRNEEFEEKWRHHMEDLEACRPFRDLEYVFKTGAGEIGHASISGHPIFDETQNFMGYRGTGRDITKRVEAERYAQELLSERDIAITANAVTNQFLATMSHELRTPLNAIIGFSEVMTKELVGPMENKSYKGYATDILDSAQHLLSVVEDLLNVSCLDIADDNLDIERIAAGRFVSDVFRLTRSLAEQRGIKLMGRTPDPGFELDIDLRALRQVMFNLLSNAFKFTPRGGSVEVSCIRVGGGAADITVRDTGCGIDEAELPRLFEPFRTIDPLVARENGGAGLGLWICKRIIDAHGGEITVTSTPGQGTAVTVCVPGRGDARRPLQST